MLHPEVDGVRIEGSLWYMDDEEYGTVPIRDAGREFRPQTTTPLSVSDTTDSLSLS